MTAPPAVVAWHDIARQRDPSGLADLLADDVVFRSPAVYEPQRGRTITAAYLRAAIVVLGPTLRYVEEWHGDTSAVLEFEAHLDATLVQGVDMVRWDTSDRITEFTVMVRPVRGLQVLIDRMGRELAGG